MGGGVDAPLGFCSVGQMRRRPAVLYVQERGVGLYRPADTPARVAATPTVRQSLEQRGVFRICKTGCRVSVRWWPGTLERLEPVLAPTPSSPGRSGAPDRVIGRTTPEASCGAALDRVQRRAAQVAISRRPSPGMPPPLPAMPGEIARHGGHLGTGAIAPGPSFLDRLAAHPRSRLGNAVGFRSPCPINRVETWAIDRDKTLRSFSRTERSPIELNIGREQRDDRISRRRGVAL